MSNIANPGCCCDIGPYYPWLCYETGTLGATAPYTGQIVRTPIVTVSFNAYGSGTVPWYDADSSYASGSKVYVSSDNHVYTATEEVGLDGMAAGSFDSELWEDLGEVPNQDIDKHCVAPNGSPVDSTADKHYIRFDVIDREDSWEDSGTPIAEIGNMALRTPGVSYAWHIIEDKRSFPTFSESVDYNSGDLVTTSYGSSDSECPGGITCDEILFPGVTDCCTEWVAKDEISASTFDKDEWQVVDPNMSKYWLVLADWSQPEAWVSGEPGTIIASRNLSSKPVASDPIYDNTTDGYEGKPKDEYSLTQIREPAEDFMVKRPSTQTQENLMMLPQVKRAFMSNTMSSYKPLSRGETLGWGNQSTNIRHGWEDKSWNDGKGEFKTSLCNKAKKHDAKGGDAPSHPITYGAEISAGISTISADDKDFYYFEIVPLAGGGTPILCGDSETCGQVGEDGEPVAGSLPGGACCERRWGDYPQEEGAMRRKIVVQHWHRDGDTINYSGNLDYPNCSGNWKGAHCEYGGKSSDDGRMRTLSSCDPQDCNDAYGIDETFWTNEDDAGFSKCSAARPADIIYSFEGFDETFGKRKRRKTWHGDSICVGGYNESNSYTKTQKFGAGYYETHPQVYAIAPRVPMRSLSIRSRRWGPPSYAETISNPSIKAPDTCVMSNYQCNSNGYGAKSGIYNGSLTSYTEAFTPTCECGLPKQGSPNSATLDDLDYKYKWVTIPTTYTEGEDDECNPPHVVWEYDEEGAAIYEQCPCQNPGPQGQPGTTRESIENDGSVWGDVSDSGHKWHVEGIDPHTEGDVKLWCEGKTWYDCSASPPVIDIGGEPQYDFDNYVSESGDICHQSNVRGNGALNWERVGNYCEPQGLGYPQGKGLSHYKKRNDLEDWMFGTWAKNCDDLWQFYYCHALPRDDSYGAWADGVIVPRIPSCIKQKYASVQEYDWQGNPTQIVIKNARQNIPTWQTDNSPDWDNAGCSKTYADVCALYEKKKQEFLNEMVLYSFDRDAIKREYPSAPDPLPEDYVQQRFICSDTLRPEGNPGSGVTSYDLMDNKWELYRCGESIANVWKCNTVQYWGCWSPSEDFLTYNCGYCFDSKGGAFHEVQDVIDRDRDRHKQYDWSHPGRLARCSKVKFNISCRKMDNLTNKFNVYSELLVGYPMTGLYPTGQAYHHNNKNLNYTVKSTRYKLWSKNFEYESRPYNIGNYSLTPLMGVTLYGYDAGQEGIDSYGASDITDMVPHTLLEPVKTNYEYFKKRSDAPVEWKQIAAHYGNYVIDSRSIWDETVHRESQTDLADTLRGAFAVCSTKGEKTIECYAGFSYLPSVRNIEESPCKGIIDAHCNCIASQSYGPAQVFFRKYKLWNKLFITEPRARAIYALPEHDCEKQYQKGDIIEYDACEWVAQKQTFNPTGTWVGEPKYRGIGRFNCAVQYAAGDKVRNESGSLTYIWEAKVATKDPATECPACPEICPYDCDVTYASGDKAIFAGSSSQVQYVWEANQPVETGNCIEYPEWNCTGIYSRGQKVTVCRDAGGDITACSSVGATTGFWIACTGDNATYSGDGSCCTAIACGDYPIFQCTGEYEAWDIVISGGGCEYYTTPTAFGPYQEYDCSGVTYVEGDIVTYNGSLYERNEAVGDPPCFKNEKILPWHGCGPTGADGLHNVGVGDNNAYPIGSVVSIEGDECDQCGVGRFPSDCWTAVALDDRPTGILDEDFLSLSDFYCAETYVVDDKVRHTGSDGIMTGWIATEGVSPNADCFPDFSCRANYEVGDVVKHTGSDGIMTGWVAKLAISPNPLRQGYIDDSIYPYDNTVHGYNADGTSDSWCYNKFDCEKTYSIGEQVQHTGADGLLSFWTAPGTIGPSVDKLPAYDPDYSWDAEHGTCAEGDDARFYSRYNSPPDMVKHTGIDGTMSGWIPTWQVKPCLSQYSVPTCNDPYGQGPKLVSGFSLEDWSLAYDSVGTPLFTGSPYALSEFDSNYSWSGDASTCTDSTTHPFKNCAQQPCSDRLYSNSHKYRTIEVLIPALIEGVWQEVSADPPLYRRVVKEDPYWYEASNREFYTDAIQHTGTDGTLSGWFPTSYRDLRACANDSCWDDLECPSYADCEFDPTKWETVTEFCSPFDPDEWTRGDPEDACCPFVGVTDKDETAGTYYSPGVLNSSYYIKWQRFQEGDAFCCPFDESQWEGLDQDPTTELGCRQFVDRVMGVGGPGDEPTVYWEKCDSLDCCEFDPVEWTLSGTCFSSWLPTGVCCAFDETIWTETGLCCEFDYDKWDKGDRAYCCPFVTGEWNQLDQVSECNEGCCEFDVEEFNCHGDYNIGDYVRHTGADGVMTYWTAGVRVYSADCYDEDFCCPFDTSQWDRGDSRSPYWENGTLGCVDDTMAIDEHWYNAYYHRDANISDSSASNYNSGSYYTKGDRVVWPTGRSSYGTDHVYTNISNKNPSAADGYAGAGDDPNGVGNEGFNKDHWLIGSELTTSSEAQAFEWLDYPHNYSYPKFTRRIINHSPGALREAYPFYGGCGCGYYYECFDPDKQYGVKYEAGDANCAGPPKAPTMVVADSEGYNQSFPKSDGSFGTLRLWLLKAQPGLYWDKNFSRSTYSSIGPSDLTCGKRFDNYKVKGWWRCDESKKSTWYSQGRTQFTEKWRAVGTTESSVKCPIDNLLYFGDLTEVMQQGINWGPDQFAAYQNCRADGGKPMKRVPDYYQGKNESCAPITESEYPWAPVKTEPCYIPAGNSFGYTTGPRRDLDGDIPGMPGGGMHGSCNIRCAPDWNPNYGYCRMRFGNNVESPYNFDAFSSTDTYNWCHWRQIIQPEYFDGNNKMEFSGINSGENVLRETVKAGLPPSSYEGGLYGMDYNVDADSKTHPLLSAGQGSIQHPRLDLTSLCPAVHVIKRSENGQGLQAAIWWDSFYRWDDYDRKKKGQRESYTYKEHIRGSEAECDCESAEDATCTPCYDPYEHTINGPVHVASWRLRWFDGKDEITSAASPPSFYILNDDFNKNQGYCFPEVVDTDANGCKSVRGSRFSACWENVKPNPYEGNGVNTEQHWWMPWMEWSSDRWLYLYNFPLSTKDFENYDIELSVYSDLSALVGENKLPWAYGEEGSRGMELAHPSYIPPAVNVYNDNNPDGYPHVIVDASLNIDSICGSRGKVVGGLHPDDDGILPSPARVLHSPLENDNPENNRDNAAAIEASRKEYTAIAPSTGYPPVWEKGHGYPYQVGSIVELPDNGGSDPTKTYKAIRIDPNGDSDGEDPDTADSLFWTHLTEHNASNRAVVAGEWDADNWVEQEGDGYIWKDWMVSHNAGHGNCGKLWIPIGCRALDAYTGKEHMRATTYLANNTKNGNPDGLDYGNRRYDVLGKTVGVPLVPPGNDHSQSDDV